MSDVEKQINLKNCLTQHKLIQASKKSILLKEKPYCQTIIHLSSQSTGGLHKEVMCCWSNFRATLPSWREYMHIMAHNIPQIHPLSHKLSNLDIFYQQCFCVSFFLQKTSKFKIGESLIKVSGQKSPAGNKGWNDRLAAGNLGNRGIRWARGARWATQDGRKEGRGPRMARGGEDGQK